MPNADKGGGGPISEIFVDVICGGTLISGFLCQSSFTSRFLEEGADPMIGSDRKGDLIAYKKVGRGTSWDVGRGTVSVQRKASVNEYQRGKDISSTALFRTRC